MREVQRSTSGESESGSGTSFQDLAAMVWRRKGLLFVSLVLTLAIGAAYLEFATPIYEVRARLLVQKQGVHLDPARPWDFSDPDFLATQAQILRSPVIVREALASADYPPPQEPQTDPVVAIIESLTVDPVRGTNVLSLSFRTPHPQPGTTLVEQLIEKYAHFNHGETMRLAGRLGDTEKIQELLWQAQSRAKELAETAGAKHPELRGIEEQISLLRTLLSDREQSDRTLAESQARERIRAIDGPVCDSRPIWPRPSLLFAVCGVIGLASGLGLVCLLERIDSKLRSTDEIRGRLRLPIVGRIPEVRVPWTARSRTLFASRVVHETPGSSESESFRSLRTQVECSGPADARRVIQIVSPRQGDGKTTVAANLALSFAQLGRRVIVVDADLRCGKLHQILKVPAAHGLTSVLADGMPLAEAIERSPLAELDVLAAGPAVTNPVELLAQPEFSHMLSALREQYDVVLIDTPAILDVTEGSIVATAADCVLLTLKVGQSLATDAVRAQELLESLSANVIGVVVNGVQDATTNGYGLDNGHNGNGRRVPRADSAYETARS